MARPGLERHPKFVMLRAALGSRLLAVGALESIWATCYETGDPRLGTPDAVEAIAGWSDAGQTPGCLFAALRDCGGDGSVGFIEPDPEKKGRWQVHDLYDHAPQYVQRRMERELAREKAGVSVRELRAEAALSRWKKHRKSKPKVQTTASDNHLVASDVQTDASDYTPAPAPAPAPAQRENPPTPRKRGARPSTSPPDADLVAGEVEAFETLSGHKANPAAIRSARKLIADGKGAELVRARERYAAEIRARDTAPEFRILPHNWFGRAARWTEYTGDTPAPAGRSARDPYREHPSAQPVQTSAEKAWSDAYIDAKLDGKTIAEAEALARAAFLEAGGYEPHPAPGTPRDAA